MLFREQIDSQCQKCFWKIQYFKDSEDYKFYLLFEIANKFAILLFELNVKAKISAIVLIILAIFFNINSP
jgi:hypothetical protein